MKKLLIFGLLAISGCDKHSPEEKRIIRFMKENANDPASYEPISFRFIGPATLGNTGVSRGDSTRTGDLYEHTYRAKNGFGALMVHTTVFAIQGGSPTALPDSLAERAQAAFRP